MGVVGINIRSYSESTCLIGPAEAPAQLLRLEVVTSGVAAAHEAAEQDQRHQVLGQLPPARAPGGEIARPDLDEPRPSASGMMPLSPMEWGRPST